MKKYITTESPLGLCIAGREVWLEEDVEPMVCPYCGSEHCLEEQKDG